MADLPVRSSGRRWRQFSVRDLLLAMLWLGSLFGVYRFGFHHGHTAGKTDGWNEYRWPRSYVEVYQVRDLLRHHTGDELMLLIEAKSPDNWDRRGGPSSTSFFETNQTICVAATGEIQDEVAQTLAELRKSDSVGTR